MLTLLGVVLGLVVSGYLFYQLAVMNLPSKKSVRPHGSDREDQTDGFDE